MTYLTVREGREVATEYPVATSGALCLVTAPARYRREYTCTRPVDHDGPHVAYEPSGTALVLWAPSIHENPRHAQPERRRHDPDDR